MCIPYLGDQHYAHAERGVDAVDEAKSVVGTNIDLAAEVPGSASFGELGATVEPTPQAMQLHQTEPA